MHPKQIFTSLLLFLAYNLSAQSYLYPVKVNHKWGYINRQGKMIVEPKYDLIGLRELPMHDDDRERSGFRLVQLNDRLGLIDQNKQEVLPAQYQRIRPLSTNYFAAVIDTLFTVVNQKQQELIPERYEDIQYLGTSSYSKVVYFKVRNGRFWGVYKLGKGMVLPMQYKNIAFVDAGQGYFKAQPKGDQTTFGLLNVEGVWIVPPIYSDFEGFGENFIARLSIGTYSWAAIDTMGIVIFEPQWLAFKKLNSSLLLLTENTEAQKEQLYSLPKKELLILPMEYDSIRAVDEQYVQVYAQGQSTFLDQKGQQVITETFFAIALLENAWYKVLGRKGWGIYDLEKRRLIVPHKYRSIEKFEGATAIVSSAIGQGVINRDFEEIVPAQYSVLTMEEGKVKARRGRKLSIYELDEQGKVIGFEDFNRVNTIQVRKRDVDEYAEATSIRDSRFVQEETPYYLIYPSPKTLDSCAWSWELDRIERKILRHIVIKSGKNEVKEFPDVKRILISDSTISVALLSFQNKAQTFRDNIFKILPQRYYRPMQLYDLSNGTTLSENLYAGIRRHDFQRGLPCAAAIKTNGKMILIDGKGIPISEREFSYIGEFKFGLARVCVGGEMREISEPLEDKYQVENLQQFWNKFCFDALPANFAEAESGITIENRKIIVATTSSSSPTWGFIDTLGNLKIDLQYEYVRDMYDQQAEAVKDGDWGVINAENEIIIPFEYGHISNYYGSWKTNQRNQGIILFNRKGWEICSYCYDEIKAFEEGFSRVSKDGKWGFMNDEGQEIVPCIYEEVRNFSEDLAAVKKAENWAFIDTSGKVVFELKAGETTGDFHEGKCTFQRNKKYGYLNKKGEEMIAPIFTKTFDFNNENARVVKNGKTGLIDEQGKFLITPEKFQIIYPFNEYGVAVAMLNYASGKHGLINRKGKVLAPFVYASIAAFQEEISIVSDGKKYGFLHITGGLIQPIQYYQVAAFSDGFAAVKKAQYSAWEYINKEGEKAFDQTFAVAKRFENGYASVQLKEGDASTQKVLTKNGQLLPLRSLFYQNGIFGMYSEHAPTYGHHYFYGDEKGNNIFDQHFQEINPFIGNYAFVQQYRRRAVMDKRGMMTLRPKYLAVEMLGDGFIIVHPPAFGIVNHDGKTILPPIFDQVLLVSGEIYRVEQGERIGYVDLEGKWIWELRN